MPYLTGSSKRSDVNEAIDEAVSGFNASPVNFIIYFSDYNRFKEIGPAIERRFPNITVVGAVSEKVAVRGKFYDEGLAVCGFSEDTIRTEVAVLNRASTAPVSNISAIRDALERAGMENTVALLINCGNTFADDKVADCLYLSLGKYEIPVFGGSAAARADLTSDDPFPHGLVFYHGHVLSDSSLVIFLHNNRGKVHLYSANIYTPMGHSFQITSADARRRVVNELNNMPAADAIAEVLDCDRDTLIKNMRYHPLGRTFGKTNLIGEAARVNDDGSIEFRVRFYNQTMVNLMEPRDYEKHFTDVVDKIKRESGETYFTMIASCISQAAFLERNAWLDGLVKNFDRGLQDYICFFPYGEQFNYVYMNQTTVFASFTEE